VPSVKSAKQKGRLFEAWCRDVLALALGVPHDRLNTRGAGAPGCDVWAAEGLRESLPYCVECKARTRLTPYETMRQARRNCYEGMFPLALAHSRGEHLAFLPTLHFLAILQELNERPGWAERVARREEALRRKAPAVSGARIDPEKPARKKEGGRKPCSGKRGTRTKCSG